MNVYGKPGGLSKSFRKYKVTNFSYENKLINIDTMEETIMKIMEKALKGPSCLAQRNTHMQHWMKDDNLAVGTPPATTEQMMLVNQLINMSDYRGARGARHEN